MGHTWRGRWDSFCLVTPNWTMSLPGFAYAGEDPEGFVRCVEIVGYLERYASSFGAPVQEGVEVQSLEPGPDSRFLLRTPPVSCARTPGTARPPPNPPGTAGRRTGGRDG